jgi:hypothetical protein
VPRFISFLSWLAIAVAAAFLVVATAAFSLGDRHARVRDQRRRPDRFGGARLRRPDAATDRSSDREARIAAAA